MPERLAREVESLSNTVPGKLLSYFVTAVVLTIPTCWIVVMTYRRAVGRAMRRSGGAPSPSPSTGAPDLPPARPLQVGGPSSAASPRTRLTVVYAAAGIAAAGVLTAFQIATDDIELTPFRVALLGYVHCWPLAPTLSRLLEHQRARLLGTAFAYVALGALMTVGWSLIGRFVLGHAGVAPLANLRGYAILLGLTALLPFPVVLISGFPRLRPVAPMALAGLLVFSFGALGIQTLFVRAFDFATLRSPLLAIGYMPLFLLASLPMGLFCWCALGWLARRYESKRTSDIQLLIDAWWLIAVFGACLDLSTQNGWRALWALVAFAVYRAVVAVGLAVWRLPATAASPSGRLLLLRVFGPSSRAERLFDFVAGLWRYDGNVNLIGGADLAARTLDPGELLTFVSGRLQSQFVRDQEDLRRRLASLDEVRDPDGRYRVNDFFCFADAWRWTLESLLGRCDVVLMDLRGFQGQNEGCRFELGKLAAHNKLAQTVFLLDRRSDEGLLRATIAQALEAQGVMETPPLQIVRLTSTSTIDLRGLVRSLRRLADRADAPRFATMTASGPV